MGVPKVRKSYSLSEHCESGLPPQEGKKYDTEKLRTDLIPIAVTNGLAQVLTHGAKKYGDRNWESGIDFNRIYGAAFRHLFAWWDGEDIDPESGLNHLKHALCNIAFLIHYTEKPGYSQFDNRPVYSEGCNQHTGNGKGE